MNQKKVVYHLTIMFILLQSFPVLSQWNYYVNDHLGNTRVVLDEDGDVKEFYDYYPFGMTMRDNVTGSEKARYTFTGKEEDQEQGLKWYYFGARYYDAEIGRWLGVDPMAEKYPGWSPYNYSLANPINNFDPDGKIVLRFKSKHHMQKSKSWGQIWSEFKNNLNNPVQAMGPTGALAFAAVDIMHKLDPYGVAGFANPMMVGSVIIRGGRTINSAERAIGEFLSSEGKTVEFLAEKGFGRTADALVDNVLTEFKTVSNLTSKDISGALASRILSGRGQAGHILIDARGQQGLTKELAERAIRRAFGMDKEKKAIQGIRIIGDEFDIKIVRNN